MSDVLSAEARHNERLEQELISQGRCPYCGWRTVVSGRGQVCGSCVRDAVATRLAAAEALTEQLRAERDAAETRRGDERLALLRRFEYLQFGAEIEGPEFARHVCPVCGWPKEGHGGPGRYKGNAANTHEQGCSMDEVLHGRRASRIASDVDAEAAARAGGCAADARAELLGMADQAWKGMVAASDDSAGYALAAGRYHALHDAINLLFPAEQAVAVSGQTAEKEEA